MANADVKRANIQKALIDFNLSTQISNFTAIMKWLLKVLARQVSDPRPQDQAFCMAFSKQSDLQFSADSSKRGPSWPCIRDRMGSLALAASAKDS